MKNIRIGLFGRVVIAIIAGASMGLFAPEVAVRVFKTFNVFFAQILRFVVPLLILGLVTPSIADVGKGAGKLLIMVLAGAYLSSVAAGFFAYGLSSHVFPGWLPTGIAAVAQGGRVFEPYFSIKIPPFCDVMTALLFAFVAGIGMRAIGATAMRRGFNELGDLVRLTIEKVVIPFIPIYIFSMILEMSASGKVGSLMGAFLKVIGTGVVLSILFLVLEYTVAGIISGKNPFRCLWNMLPAYLTGFSISSSAPVIPITLAGTKKNGVSKDIAEFVIPLCATVHMPGSVIKMGVTVTAVTYMTGFDMTPTLFANFVFMQCIAAVAAPGVATGVLMASVGLLESILGFSSEQTALLMTIYLALDGYGPACSVTADGALALVFDRIGIQHARRAAGGQTGMTRPTAVLN